MSTYTPADPRYVVSAIFNGTVFDASPKAIFMPPEQSGPPELRIKSDDGFTRVLVTPSTSFFNGERVQVGDRVECGATKFGCANWVRKLPLTQP